MPKCPGQDTRFWTPDDISEVECGECGKLVEFFKTDGYRRCPNCGRRIINPKVRLGCAQWCEHARECLGFDPKNAQTGPEGERSVADRLAEAVREVFGRDERRIQHARRVLDYAQQLLQQVSADPAVVVAAALLHDIGIARAEDKYDSAAARYQESEGPPLARAILEDCDFDAVTIDHVCDIVASHHSGGKIDTPEFRVVWDADRLVNIEEGEIGGDGADSLRRTIEKVFKTSAGKQIALSAFADRLQQKKQP